MEKLFANVKEALEKAMPLNYSESQEIRISCELCDRGHMEYSLQRVYDKAGMKFPLELYTVLSDPEFDVRMTCMKGIASIMEEVTAPGK